jgi:hypothetical protein
VNYKSRAKTVVQRPALNIRTIVPDTAQPVAANNINLVIDSVDAINPLQNPLQKSPQIKVWNAAADRKHTVTMFKLESVNTTAKMAVMVQFLTDQIFDLNPRRGWPPSFFLR